ncbi:MAG TPA: malto-oligosyltrehalose synthase [Alphaproteobacteria bacterium]|nr:malto-oligosyltrehalose synthase [Alphaproteobacteria bacterium]
MNDPLLDLAREVGLQRSYTDAWGTKREVDPTIIVSILSALGFRGDPETELTHFRAREIERILPSAIVIRGRSSATVTVPAGRGRETVTASVTREQGDEETMRYRLSDLQLVDRRDVNGKDYERRLLPLPIFPVGYHRLRVTIDGRQAESLLIAAPERCWDGGKAAAAKLWGLAVQLYALRSSRNWGIGDFTDLSDLIERAAAAGASAIGLNPLHALFPDEPERASPYSPSTRLFVNPLYLDIEAIPDFARSPEARALVSSYDFQRELGRLRGTDLVSYASVAVLKYRVLRMLFERFERAASPIRRRAFARFVEERGPTLHRLGTFERLRELRSAEDLAQRDWRNWPPEYRNPESLAVTAFAEKEATAIRFSAYLQWQIDEQLSACLARAKALGLPIGIYTDLAVGVDAGGAEAWWNQSSIVRGLGVGAPPDQLNTKGQAWGLPLFSPVELAEQAFEPFIAVLRANMRHAGAIRIDHILGLMRLWCVPDGNEPRDGAYLTYPVKDLIAILALESQRQRCVVIGEDLGTLPPGFADVLAGAGILSYSVLYFEREGTEFRPLDRFKRDALTTIGTHDLPPLARWWHGDDLRLREKLGLLDPAFLEKELAQRREERAALARWAGRTETSDRPPVVPIHRTLARTPPRLMMAQFEDVLPEARQMNLPGTMDEYPSWRIKLEVDLPSLFSDRLISDVLDAISIERPPWFARSEDRVVDTGPVIAALPRATYRLQFNAGFTFAHAERLVDYFAALGVSHIYASPIFRARPGSSHGYDITDYDMINPEIGTKESFDRLVAKLREAGIGVVLDFVPNHMGIGKADNDWWLDVLEWGLSSPYANYFDIDWRSSRRLMRGKVLLPFLGDQYGAVLERGELDLRFDSEFGTFSVWYGEHRFPVRPFDYAPLLRAAGHPATSSLAQGFDELSPGGAGRRVGVRQSAAMLKQALANLKDTAPDAVRRIDDAVALVNMDARHQAERSTLHRLLERQHYRLAYWRVAADEINYRRFFDINDLSGVKVERSEVFRATHRGIVSLIAKGAIQGIRLDHIDGLADPLQYLRRLFALARRYAPKADRARSGSNPYLLVEKILGHEERLRPEWPIAGTTGYEFANLVTGIFVDPAGRPIMDAAYRENGGAAAYDGVVHAAKVLVMDTLLASELSLLAERLERIAKADLSTRDFGARRLRRALAEIIAGMDVYRTYMTGSDIAIEDRRRIAAAVERARRRWRGTDRSILDFAEGVLTREILRDSDPRAADVEAFTSRFQQYTGPVMAKAAEDTAFYRYNRLLALNEVGGDPGRFGLSVERFHEANLERALRWPASMVATSTHDSKRGEDARMRIAALSEMANEWRGAVARWVAIDRSAGTNEQRPHPNDAYLIYQTLVGSWPAAFVGLTPESIPTEALEDFQRRLEAYVIKAAREAKLATNWTDPNAIYERATVSFVARLLDRAGPFLRDFMPFQSRLARLGAAGSMAQLVLKLTVPGVPDIYQGSELWNLSMADPDNRRPAPYDEAWSLLRQSRTVDRIDWSPQAWKSGKVKQEVLRRLLALRRDQPNLFGRGNYRPLATEGVNREHVVAFSRRFGDAILLVAVGRLMRSLLVGDEPQRPALAWRNASVHVPATGATWRELLSERSLRFEELMNASDLMGDRPVGVWICQGG